MSVCQSALRQAAHLSWYFPVASQPGNRRKMNAQMQYVEVMNTAKRLAALATGRGAAYARILTGVLSAIEQMMRTCRNSIGDDQVHYKAKQLVDLAELLVVRNTSGEQRAATRGRGAAAADAQVEGRRVSHARLQVITASAQHISGLAGPATLGAALGDPLGLISVDAIVIAQASAAAAGATGTAGAAAAGSIGVRRAVDVGVSQVTAPFPSSLFPNHMMTQDNGESQVVEAHEGDESIIACDERLGAIPPETCRGPGRHRETRFRSHSEASVGAKGYKCTVCDAIGHTRRSCPVLRSLGTRVLTKDSFVGLLKRNPVRCPRESWDGYD